MYGGGASTCMCPKITLTLQQWFSKRPIYQPLILVWASLAKQEGKWAKSPQAEADACHRDPRHALPYVNTQHLDLVSEPFLGHMGGGGQFFWIHVWNNFFGKCLMLMLMMQI